MMQFDRERHERHFQLAFNRVAIRSDVLYGVCLAVFGLLAAFQLRSVPGADGAVRRPPPCSPAPPACPLAVWYCRIRALHARAWC